MKMGLNTFIYLLCFNCCVSFSQIENAPSKYSKIRFTYHTKSNYHFDYKGVYGDTLLLKIDLPNKKITLVNSPLDHKTVWGFIPKQNFDYDELRSFSYKVTKNYISKEVVFNLKRKKAEETVVAVNFDLIPKIVISFFGDALDKRSFPHNSTILYNDNFEYHVRQRISGNQIIAKYQGSYENKVIKWIEGESYIGIFEQPQGKLFFNNVIEADQKLDRYIVPQTTLYSNCQFGIKKIRSISYTVELIKVSYN